MLRPAMFVRFARDTIAALDSVWSRIWLQDTTTTPLELTRIGIGAAVLINYGLATPFLFEFWGETGWMPASLALDYSDDPWMQSIFFYFSTPLMLILFHILFLLCAAALMVGWRTSWVKW